MRSISTKGHITYSDFIELLSPPDQEEAALEQAPAAEQPPPDSGAIEPLNGANGPVGLSRQLSRITPKGEKELDELMKAAISEEDVEEQQLRETLQSQVTARRHPET